MYLLFQDPLAYRAALALIFVRPDTILSEKDSCIANKALNLLIKTGQGRVSPFSSESEISATTLTTNPNKIELHSFAKKIQRANRNSITVASNLQIQEEESFHSIKIKKCFSGTQKVKQKYRYKNKSTLTEERLNSRLRLRFDYLALLESILPSKDFEEILSDLNFLDEHYATTLA